MDRKDYIDKEKSLEIEDEGLSRSMSPTMCIALSITNVAVISCIAGLFTTAMANGGPAVIMWSWIAGSFFTLLVGCSLSELASAYPSSGSVYYYAAALAPPGWGPFMAYLTGWINLIGCCAATTFGAFAFTNFVEYYLMTIGFQSFEIYFKVVISSATLSAWALLNLLRVEHQGYINTLGAAWQIVCTLAVMIGLFTTCPKNGHMSSIHDVFFTFNNESGFESTPYVLMIGSLSTLYCFTGYEGGTHMAEETREPRTAVPKSVLYTCLVTAVLGFLFWLNLMLASAHDPAFFSDPENGITTIFIQCMGQQGGSILTLLVAINLFFGGMACITITTRIAYCMAVDQGVPVHHYMSKIHPRNQIPIYSLFGTYLISFLLGLLPLVNDTAFTAVTSIATIGYQLSYAIPIILRVTYAKNTFKPSEFSLGKWSVPCGQVSALFLVATSVFLCLPAQYPITMENFNYTPVILAFLSLLIGLFWKGFANKFFKGPDLCLDKKSHHF